MTIPHKLGDEPPGRALSAVVRLGSRAMTSGAEVSGRILSVFGLAAGDAAGALRRPRRALAWALFLAGFVLLDRSAGLFGASGADSPWDLAGGLAFAFLLTQGAGAVGALMLVAVIERALTPGAPIGAAAASAAMLVMSYGVAAAWLRGRGVTRLEQQSDLIALVLAALAASLAHVAADLVLLGRGSGLLDRSWTEALLRLWTAAFTSILVAAPLVMAPAPLERRLSRAATIELVSIALALVAIMALTFPNQPQDRFRYFYLLFLPQVWAAARFGVRGAALGDLGVQAGLVVYFLAGASVTDMIFAFEFRLLALVGTMLFLGCSVTERRGLEATLRRRQEELARASRLTLAGEMAAALAHQLNQPLLAAMAFTRSAQRLLRASRDEPAAVAAMDEAVAEVDRAGAIVRSLREFIGRSNPARQAFSLEELVRETVQLAASDAVKAAARLEILPAEAPLPRVFADRVQVQQVLINLIQNALDAVAASDAPRRIFVGARRVSDGLLEAEVRDNGPGLSELMTARLFEPFASEKPGGMGLGLAVSRGLIEAQGGRLWLEENTPGRCAFRFTLRLARGALRAMEDAR